MIGRNKEPEELRILCIKAGCNALIPVDNWEKPVICSECGCKYQAEIREKDGYKWRAWVACDCISR